MRKVLRIFPIFWAEIYADIIWTCEQAADLCIHDMTFIPKHEICENTFCLDSNTDLCDEHSVFQSGRYGKYFCEKGQRDQNQVSS